MKTCPACNSKNTDVIYNDRQQKYQYFTGNIEFINVEIGRCEHCGHGINWAFNKDMIPEIYSLQPQTNVPVSSGMTARIRELAELLYTSLNSKSRVLEIGGGSLGLAKELAKKAQEITVFEPNSTISKELHSLAQNIRLEKKYFARVANLGRFDLIIARQVAEHIYDLDNFFVDISDSLTSQGSVYIEVPSFEYITKHGLTCDIHPQHIHYFTPQSLQRQAAKFGLYCYQYQEIMGGHDFGLLLKKELNASSALRESLNPFKFDRWNWEELLRRNTEFYNSMTDEIVLYGATAQALEPLRNLRIYKIVDDNPFLIGHKMYGARGLIDIVNLDSALSTRTFLISAYLHSKIIKNKILTQASNIVVLNYPHLDMEMPNKI